MQSLLPDPSLNQRPSARLNWHPRPNLCLNLISIPNPNPNPNLNGIPGPGPKLSRSRRPRLSTSARKNRWPAAVAAAVALITLLATIGPQIAAPAPAEPGSPAAAAIARYVAWLGGWDALNALQDVNMTGQSQTSGLSGIISTRQRRDGRSRTEYDFKVVRGGATVTPDDAWSINAGGQVEELGTSKAEDERRSLARNFGDHLRGIGVTITDLGTVSHGGRDWEGVRFSYPNGDQDDLLLDPAAGSLEWERSLVDTYETWNHLTDWRMVNGLRFPFHQEMVTKMAANSEVQVLVEWDQIATNAGIPDDVFVRPGARRSPIRIASGAARTEWAPLDLYEHSYLYLHGTVNGADADLVLDSGAGMTVLDSVFAAGLGLKPEGSVPAVGSGGTSTAAMVRGVSIRVDGLAADGLTAAVIDLRGVSKMMGRAMPCVFGKEVFNNLIVDLDYPDSRIRFCNPDSFRYEGAGHRIPLYPREGGHREVEARIENLPPARFHLDTGNGGTLDVFGYYSDANHLLDGRAPVSARMSGGVGGANSTTVATLHALTVAGYTLKDVPASFSHAESGAFDTRREAGNLGAGILSRFRVLFDYPHESLWLEPGQGWDTTPFRKDRTGLSLQLGDGDLEVVFVAPGSPAAQAGWKAGERIVEVDGQAINGESYSKKDEGWSMAPAGKVVHLKLATGEKRKLKLADYY